MNLKQNSKAANNKAVATTNKHPKVSEMVLLAIAILNERNGSSFQAIKKYIAASFNLDEKKISAYVKRYLIMAVASGTLIQTKGKGLAGSFRLGGCMKFKMSELMGKLPEQIKQQKATDCDMGAHNVPNKKPKKSKRGKAVAKSSRAV